MDNAAVPRRAGSTNSAAALRQLPGPLERTVLELRRIDRHAVWRRPRVSRTRLLLRESDALIDLIERCRERGDRLLPTQLWSAVVRFVGGLDSKLRDELGINRAPAHVSDVLFATQDLLLERSREERSPVTGRIIPLFSPERPEPERPARRELPAAPSPPRLARRD